MEENQSLQDYKKRFDENLDQVFRKFNNLILDYYESKRIDLLYTLVRKTIPNELIEWVSMEKEFYNLEISQYICAVVEKEEKVHKCPSCKYHRELIERVVVRLSNPPKVSMPILGPNNVYYQGIGTFGLVGGGIYIGLGYTPVDNLFFSIFQIGVSLGLGYYYGYKSFKKYDQLYRNFLLETGVKFLAENKKLLEEWFDQIIYFSEGERENCGL